MFQIVIRSEMTISNHLEGSGGLIVLGSGITTEPPALRSPNISYTDRSKLRLLRASTRSRAVTANRLFRSSIVFIAPRWWQQTPLGMPVEPEV